ncbi:MAG: hypothetical protein AAGA68_25590 [Pseudomonadota bacterium]
MMAIPLPDLAPVDKVVVGPEEVVICAAGFEDRATALSKCAVLHPQAPVVILRYLPANRENRLSHLRRAWTDLGGRTDDADVLDYHRFRPDDFSDRLKAQLSALKAPRVLIDISAMSRLLIMLVIESCRSLQLTVRIFYAEAAEYGPSMGEYEKYEEDIHRPSNLMFTALQDVIRVSELSSVSMQGEPTALISFLSFNEVFTQAVINRVNPGKVFLINGRPPELRWRERATAWLHEHVIGEWPETNRLVGGLPERVACTRDYQASVRMLLDLYWALSAEHRIVLSPTGSKMQTVACALVRAVHRDIHIEYPIAAGFVKEYSSGVGSCWVVDFRRLEDLIGDIRRAEQDEQLMIRM